MTIIYFINNNNKNINEYNDNINIYNNNNINNDYNIKL
jgi:hypothetical protein